MKFALFVRFCLFAYTAYHMEKSLDSIKKHVTVRKIFPRALILEQLQLSSAICLDITLVKWRDG